MQPTRKNDIPTPHADSSVAQVSKLSAFVPPTESQQGQATGSRLPNSEELLWAFMEASSYAVYRMSADWSEMDLLQGHGFLADTSSTDRKWLEHYILPEDQSRVLKAVQAAIENQCIFELEHRVRKADGGIGWTLSRAVPIITDEGKIEQWIGAATDVTDRRAAQEELRNTKETLSAVFDCLPVGMAIFDQQDRFALQNQKMRRYAAGGMSPSQDEANSEQWAAYDRGVGKIPQSNAPHANALRGEAVVPRMEMLHTSTDGTKTWTRVATIPVRDAAGLVVGRIVTVTDIDDLKKEAEQLEEEIGSANDALGRTRIELQALSRHLITVQEEEGRRIARELHDDLGQRIAVIALHLDYLQPLLMNDGDSALRTLRAEVHELSARLRSVSHRLHPSIVEILGFSDALVALIAEFAEGDRQVTFNAESGIQLGLDSATALYRICQEALRNIQKHAPTAPVDIRCWTDGESLLLRIRDYGLGFNLAQLQPGSGLGLISMQERARLVGGTVLLSSRLQKGTTVLIRLPI